MHKQQKTSAMKTKNLYERKKNKKVNYLISVLLIGFLFLFSCNRTNNSDPDLPPPPQPEIGITEPATKDVVEIMPEFPGGDTALVKYILDNTKYPPDAKEKSIQGQVVIRFCISAEGAISQISVLKGVDPALDAEAIRVVSTLPAFKPGMDGGKKVPVWYMLPITFSLK